MSNKSFHVAFWYFHYLRHLRICVKPYYTRFTSWCPRSMELLFPVPLECFQFLDELISSLRSDFFHIILKMWTDFFNVCYSFPSLGSFSILFHFRYSSRFLFVPTMIFEGWKSFPLELFLSDRKFSWSELYFTTVLQQIWIDNKKKSFR